MTEHEKSFFTLAFIGALIAIAKTLDSDEPLTPRRMIGRAILGSAVSVVAGAALIQFPNIHPLAVNGIGAMLGILGYQSVEMWLHKRSKIKMEKKKNDTF